jgi:DNA-binding transcriptional LysR family regulator
MLEQKLSTYIYQNSELFCTLVECKNFSKTADKLNITQSAVSKRIKKLEGMLGVKLIIRNTRNIDITDYGNILYDFLLSEGSRLDTLLKQIKTSPIFSKVRVLIPDTLSYYSISKDIWQFSRNNPKIELEIIYEQSKIDIFNETFDFAITRHQPEQQSIIAKYLGSMSINMYCTPSYIAKYGKPNHPNELKNHLYNGYIESDHTVPKYLQMTSPDGHVFVIPNSSKIKTNSIMQSLILAKDGEMIVSGFEVAFADLVKEGKMVHIFPDFKIYQTDYYMIKTSRQNKPAVTMFANFIEEKLSKYLKKRTQI